jgi:hypothetical protein
VGYHCSKCFYEPKTPKQRLSVIAVALAVGCLLLVILGGSFMWAGVSGGIVLLVMGALMGWGALKW